MNKYTVTYSLDESQESLCFSRHLSGALVAGQSEMIYTETVQYQGFGEVNNYGTIKNSSLCGL